ncbi:MAG: ABC transporter ATP-binding protein [Bacillota bacterium]
MVVETFDLTKVYPGGGCRDVTLAVGEGEIFGLLGPNGAGKSTFVKMLVGLLTPSRGGARLLGRPLGDINARTEIGFLPENFRYHQWLTAAGVLKLHGALAGLSAGEAGERVPRVLDLVGLPGTDNKKVGAFSKGMQQRLGLAAVLLAKPRLVFLDEPTSALDPVGRRDVRQLIRELREQGVTVFLNSHLLSEVEQVCSRVAVIKDGRVVAEGELPALLHKGLEVRIEVDEVNEALLEGLRPFVRHLRREGAALVVRVRDREDIPRLARVVLDSGRALYALEPGHESLESLFLELIGGGEDA